MSRANFEQFLIGIGGRLKHYRNDIKGLTQGAFGEPVHKSANAIKNYEKGPKGNRDFKIPLEYLFAVSEHYEIRLEWLIFGISPIQKKSKKTT